MINFLLHALIRQDHDTITLYKDVAYDDSVQYPIGGEWLEDGHLFHIAALNYEPEFNRIRLILHSKEIGYDFESELQNLINEGWSFKGKPPNNPTIGLMLEDDDNNDPKLIIGQILLSILSIIYLGN